ncbi:MAG: class I SAM-dependent methyltransferase [Candidatus Pacebacteria bacterium]|nr:class I SAM-dependent methyltransferase [Candidatus Paceibacterota bacterium]
MKTSDPKFRVLQQPAQASLPAFEAEKRIASNRLKTFFKQWPGLYLFLRETFGPTHSPFNGFYLSRRVRDIFTAVGANAIVMNVGSGATRVHPEIINVDIFPFRGVDLVADIGDLPLRDAVVDGVVCDSVLEHLPDTSRALTEIARVLKPGGVFLVTGLFMYPYHSSPSDYYRWTEQGTRYQLELHGFHIEELGVRGGPMGALQGVLMHIFAMPFSRVSPALYFGMVQFFMVLFSPLKILDLIWMRLPASLELASDVYVVAIKK